MVDRLSRDAIVEAALDVLDEGGAGAVTVRAVAARLGVQAPALYYHVKSKQDLLDRMGTEITRRVVSALGERVSDGDWVNDLRAYAMALRGEYLLHRDGARTFSGTLITEVAVLRAQEPWLRRWHDSGIPAAAMFDAIEIVTAFVVGFVIEEQERSRSAEDPERYSPEIRGARLGADSPLVTAAGYAWTDATARFDRQLALVLEGVRHSARAEEDLHDGA